MILFWAFAVLICQKIHFRMARPIRRRMKEENNICSYPVYCIHRCKHILSFDTKYIYFRLKTRHKNAVHHQKNPKMIPLPSRPRVRTQRRYTKNSIHCDENLFLWDSIKKNSNVRETICELSMRKCTTKSHIDPCFRQV